ncbi:hypothetical protein NPIL_479261 [Nephila pilipes]|uniref:Uncharacterized protein n=1 Tax=Nephila pilipes TaxID=299642 RepID=A0A8X6Q237_NEPPI|nr:hypothetical protein NPIL_479261 [Nephila pilipes]
MSSSPDLRLRYSKLTTKENEEDIMKIFFSNYSQTTQKWRRSEKKVERFMDRIPPAGVKDLEVISVS